MLRKFQLCIVVAAAMIFAGVAFAGTPSMQRHATHGTKAGPLDQTVIAQRRLVPSRVRPPRVRKRAIRRAPVVRRRAIIRRRAPNWRGRYWGRVAFGVTLGTIIVVAANAAPPPPDPKLCWTWSDDSRTKGYWYYCDGE